MKMKTYIEKKIWLLKLLFFKYVLRHTNTIGADIGSQDGDCVVIFRTDRKGNRIVERFI